MIKESEINIISLCTHESICAEILENIIKKYPQIKYIFCENLQNGVLSVFFTKAL